MRKIESLTKVRCNKLFKNVRKTLSSTPMSCYVGCKGELLSGLIQGSKGIINDDIKMFHRENSHSV